MATDFLNDARREIEGRTEDFYGELKAFYQGNAKAEQNLMEQTTQPFWQSLCLSGKRLQQQGRGILCGIGINLAQPQSYFDAADLPHGTSLALQGAAVDLAADPTWLAEGLTDFGFDRNLYTFARDGFAPFREEYKAACINLGRRVTFDLPDGSQGAGEAMDVDAEGRLVVRTDAGEQHVFTGEVSVHGIYGAV